MDNEADNACGMINSSTIHETPSDVELLKAMPYPVPKARTPTPELIQVKYLTLYYKKL